MPAEELTCTATFTKDAPQPSYVPETAKITGGCFQMGSLETEMDREPWEYDETQHKVYVDDFEMGKYEVIFDEYDAFTTATGREEASDIGSDSTPSHWGCGRRPVINVSWNDAGAYAEWLSEKTGKTYRLPTEAEWEYAARAGTTEAYWMGYMITHEYANYDWNTGKTQTVGSYPENPWGLYDTMGNVSEWTCSDASSPYSSSLYNGDEKKCSTSTTGFRALRGGAWDSHSNSLRSANRARSAVSFQYYNIGFRVILPASRP